MMDVPVDVGVGVGVLQVVLDAIVDVEVKDKERDDDVVDDDTAHDGSMSLPSSFFLRCGWVSVRWGVSSELKKEEQRWREKEEWWVNPHWRSLQLTSLEARSRNGGFVRLRVGETECFRPFPPNQKRAATPLSHHQSFL
jgi:hypothetical protein